MIDENKREKLYVKILGHNYIARISEIRRLLSHGSYDESIDAISSLEHDMYVVLTVGDIHDLKNRVIN